MKFSIKIVVLLFVISFISCKKKEVFLVELPYQEDFSINPGLNTLKTWYFNINNIKSNKNELFDANGIDEADVTKINPGSARLLDVLGDANYSIIRRISVRIFGDNPDDFKEIFYRESVPLNTKSQLDLIPTLVDASEYLNAENFNVVVRIDFRVSPDRAYENKLTFSLLAI